MKVEDPTQGETGQKREQAAGRGAAVLRVLGRRRVAMGGRVGLGHRGRGTLTLAGSPLPFPYTAAPASPGPAPASVWTAVDTRPSTRYHGTCWASLTATTNCLVMTVQECPTMFVQRCTCTCVYVHTLI